MQEPTQRFTEDAMPALHRVQLLRGLPQAGKEPGNSHIGPTRLTLLAVRAADRQRDLSSVAGLSRYCLQQQRPAGDRLAPMIRIIHRFDKNPGLAASAMIQPVPECRAARQRLGRPRNTEWLIAEKGLRSPSSAITACRPGVNEGHR